MVVDTSEVNRLNNTPNLRDFSQVGPRRPEKN